MAELGEELRRERVRRNLTFKDIEQVLHIKTTYLEAIEDGNYAVIPGRVYAKGFIRNYGNYLGLDGDRLVKVYQNQVGEVDTFTIRPIMRQKNRKPLILCRVSTLSIRWQNVVCRLKRDRKSDNGPLNKNALCLLLLPYSW